MVVALFLAFVAVMGAAVAGLSVRYLNARTSLAVTVGLFAWLAYVGLLGHSGVIGDPARRPPGIVYLFVPVVLGLAALVARVRSAALTRLATAVPPAVTLGGQAFRVVVELFLHRLWTDGLIPRMLTYAGANVDLYIGASAPLAAWVATRGRTGARLALAWNAAGLLALANVVVRAVLTAPGPLNLIRAEVPNRLIATYPYTFIPGFFVPLAAVLHVLAIRALLVRLGPGRA